MSSFSFCFPLLNVGSEFVGINALSGSEIIGLLSFARATPSDPFKPIYAGESHILRGALDFSCLLIRNLLDCGKANGAMRVDLAAAPAEASRGKKLTMDTATATLGRPYPTTIWSEVARAGNPEASEAVAALERLLLRYYRPLQLHLQSKFGAGADQSADWLQEFIQRKVLLGQLLARAAKDRGRFRTFLLNALDNFVTGEKRRETARKRRPEGGFESLDELPCDEPIGPVRAQPDPFTLDWARTLLCEALERMEAECKSKKCPERWGIFKARLLDPLLEGAIAPPYPELVARFGFRSPAEAANVLITGKRMFERLLRQVVAEYAGEGAELEDELRELKRALSA